ncbi:MAG: hypothetical protein ACJ72B_08920 [Ornithinibacter sp.]
MRVEGLRVKGMPVAVEVSATGQVVGVEAPPELEVVTATPHG